MAKYYGMIGYGAPREVAPDVFVEKIIERPYYGDIIHVVKRWENGESVNDDLKFNNQISIVADDFANDHCFEIKYAEYMGAKWRVTAIEPKYPRIILSFGGLYNEQSTGA